ncbi:unnamed protein product [Blepharisma stoltei]|uniref:Mitochondrial import inner membrane translocase subunit TIM50 n=1 Tax=Blepharisma stoltei TaxID=1481888 RepID=A0AAU9JX77_9CILI|nr:unnamed protein product [Blepharisma stoltei]
MSFRKIYSAQINSVTPAKSSSRNQTPKRGNSKGEIKKKELVPNPPSYPKSEVPKRRFLIKENPENKENSKTFMINLEDLIILEEDLYFLIENLRMAPDAVRACEEWWDLTADNTLNQIDLLYRDLKVKRLTKQALIFEAMGIALTHYFINEGITQNEQSTILKALLFDLHQGFIALIKLILPRISDDSTNMWAMKLNEIITLKSGLSGKGKGEKELKKYNSLSVKLIKQICRSYIGRIEDRTMKNLKLAFMQILQNIEKISIFRARFLIERAFGIDTSDLPALNTENQRVSPPYLRNPPTKVFTLVLDLDETLIHYFELEDKGHFAVRPHTLEFLRRVSVYYEIIIFTASISEYADWILDEIDKEKHINARLYRQHAVPAGLHFVKDLTLLGRDLKKVIIIDNVAENFQLQPMNGIQIRTWINDPNDCALEELATVLEEIAKKQVPDVREALKQLRDQMIEQISHSQGIKNPQLKLENSKDVLE